MEIDPRLEKRIEDRLRTLKQMYGVEKTREQILESALDRYLNARSDQQRYKAVRRRHFTRLYQRCGGRCAYCDSQVPRNRATIDHKVPPVRGGSPINHSNFVISCSDCNNDKGMLTDEEYRFVRKYRATLAQP